MPSAHHTFVPQWWPALWKRCLSGPQLSTMNPTGRIGEPDEVARVVAWLASEGSSFTNGATITVDGGYTAQ